MSIHRHWVQQKTACAMCSGEYMLMGCICVQTFLSCIRAVHFMRDKVKTAQGAKKLHTKVSSGITEIWSSRCKSKITTTNNTGSQPSSYWEGRGIEQESTHCAITCMQNTVKNCFIVNNHRQLNMQH